MSSPNLKPQTFVLSALWLVLVSLMVGDSPSHLRGEHHAGASRHPSSSEEGSFSLIRTVFAQRPRQSQLEGPTIAVLPFANEGDAGEQLTIGGIADEIASMLARIPGINVAGRTSGFWLKQQNRSNVEMERILKATYFLEGSARKAKGRIHMSLRLIQASDTTKLWSQDYNAPFELLFDLQQDVVKRIAEALHLQSGEQSNTPNVGRIPDIGSYELYLRARPLIRTRGPKAFADAAALLESVVARNPDFAPAAALLAYDYDLTPLYSVALRSGLAAEGRRVVESTIPRADMLARRATHLDPNGSDGFVALAYAAMIQGKLLTADDLFKQALTLDPNHPDGLHGYSQLLAAAGHIQEALAMRQRLTNLEPVFPNYLADTAVIYWLDGQTDRAVSMLDEFRPGRTAELALIRAAGGQYREAAALLAEMPAANYMPGVLDAAERILAAAPAKAPEGSLRLGNLSFAFLHAGAPERVMEYYESNLQAGYFQPISTTWFWHASYQPVRMTERFKTFARNIGLVEYWRSRGWPAFCHPAGVADFTCG